MNKTAAPHTSRCFSGSSTGLLWFSCAAHSTLPAAAPSYRFPRTILSAGTLFPLFFSMSKSLLFLTVKLKRPLLTYQSGWDTSILCYSDTQVIFVS